MRRKEERGKEEAGEDEREDGEGGELWDAGRVKEKERVESGRDGEEAGGVRRQAGTGLKGGEVGKEVPPALSTRQGQQPAGSRGLGSVN